MNLVKGNPNKHMCYLANLTEIKTIDMSELMPSNRGRFYRADIILS